MPSVRSPAASRTSSSRVASRSSSRARTASRRPRVWTSTRSDSRWASWPVSRPSTSRPWCRCGCSPMPSHAATRSCSSPRRRTPPLRCSWRSCSTKLASLPVSSMSSRVTRSRSMRSWSTRTSRRSRSWARRPSRATSMRRAPATASVSRRSAAPRTIWWCCPTRTWRWRLTRPSRRRMAPLVSAAWPSAWSWPWVTWQTRSSMPSRSVCRASRSDRAATPAPRWGRS